MHLASTGADIKAAAGGGAGPGRRKKKTVASQFKESLAKLMENIEQAQPHFIRCIKPNSDKVPSKFVPTMVFEQLTYSGALEAVKIRQAGRFRSRASPC